MFYYKLFDKKTCHTFFGGLFEKSYYKVWQAVITKWDKTLSQSVAAIARCGKKLLQTVTGITKCDNYCKVRCNNSRRDTDAK